MNTDDPFGIIHHFPTYGNNVYIRQMSAKSGWIISTHKNEYEHFSILSSGKVILETNGLSKEYSAPHVISIPAKVEHKITALTDVAWFCIHGTDENRPEKIDEVLIEK